MATSEAHDVNDVIRAAMSMDNLDALHSSMPPKDAVIRRLLWLLQLVVHIHMLHRFLRTG